MVRKGVDLQGRPMLKPHQGWDLYASAGTPVFAISDATVHSVQHRMGYGLSVILEFKHGHQHLYALYGHLMSSQVSSGKSVKEGDVIARTGQSDAMHEPAHLHFEIRTKPEISPGQGLNYRISPGRILGHHYGL